MTIATPIHPSPARFSAARLFARLTQATLLCLALVAPALLPAQETGTITGKVLKPASSEYVRYANVRVAGTALQAETDTEGVYRISGVPAGEVTVNVTYTGYQVASAPVTVAAGQVVERNFDIYAADADAPVRTLESDTVKLETYVVSSGAEGQAKSIQNQRRSMNIGDYVSSDEFGEVVEGNVGEFLKHLPGVELEYVQFDARGPRLRGMDPQYAGVTLDGVKLASADAFNATIGTDNAGTEGSRAFGFEAISLSSIDSVEVFKNLSADMDADAPAGTINLRSKRAFERKGQRISYTAGVSLNSEEFHLDRTPGPGDYKTYKAKPTGSLEYSNTFLNNRLGIVANLSHSTIFNEFMQMSMTTTNRTTSATDTRAAVPQTITFTDGPKITERDTFTFRADYKLSPTFSFGVNTTFSNYHAFIDNYQFRFVTSTTNNAAQRALVLGADPMISFTTSPTSATSLTLVGAGSHKFTESISIMPSFDWKPTPNLTIEGRFGWSESDNHYHSLSEGTAGPSVDALSGIQYTAARSDVMSSDWVFTQTGGPDWGDVANFRNTRVSDEGRTDLNEVYTGGIDLTWKKPVLGLPAFLKVGIKSREDYRKFSDPRSWLSYSYIGPGGGATGSWAGYPSAYAIDMSSVGNYFPSTSGRGPGYAGRSLVADLYETHPEYFIGNPAAQTVDNYFSSFIANNRSIYERVDAAYMMGNIRLKRLQLQAGLRFEKTTDELKQYTRRTTAEMVAAGYTVNAGTGRATTIPGLQYQYLSQPTNTRVTEYDHLFASAALKYAITPNIDFQMGINEAISRPPLTVISGVTTYNETIQFIQTPNPGLLPEESRNVSAKVTYYLPNSGTLSAGVFQINVDNLRIDFDRAPGTWFEEFPDIDPITYGNYTVRSTVNSPNARRFRGMELEYQQVLSFLPKALRSSRVYVNYTRNYADIRRGGLTPHGINVGGTLRYKRFAFGGSAKWTSETPWTQTNALRWQAERIRTDVNASYMINRWATFTVSGRDVGNVGQELIEKRDGLRNELVQKDVFGALWTFSIKGTF